jgi:hypothetical protein
MTEKQKVGWKVITRRRTSCVVNGTSASKRYLKGKQVFPNKNCGPLCVFTKKNSAKWFSAPRDGETVVKCKYTPSKEKSVWNTMNARYSLRVLPHDTTLADSVTCLE